MRVILFSLIIILSTNYSFTQTLHSNHNQIKTNIATSDSGISPIDVFGWGICKAIDYWEEYIFIGNGVFIQVYDVSLKEAPLFVSEIKLDGYVNDINVHNNYLFVGPPFRVFDISDLQKPTLIYEEFIYNSIERIYIKDDVLFLAGLLGTTRIYDISNPAIPQFITEIYSSSDPFSLSVIDTLLFIGTWDSYSLEVFSISDIYNPKLINEQYISGAPI